MPTGVREGQLTLAEIISTIYTLPPAEVRVEATPGTDATGAAYTARRPVASEEGGVYGRREVFGAERRDPWWEKTVPSLNFGATFNQRPG